MIPSEDPNLLEYDGSFPGFLCAVCDLLNETAGAGDPRDLLICGPSRPSSLFERRVLVLRDDARAERLWTWLARRAGEEAARKLMAAFCSDLEGADGSVARMIVRIRREGRDALDDLGDGDARLVEKASTRTRREAHRMTGLVRFKELRDGSLFSTIDSDCDVLALIADHFAARFPVFRWAIRDERRDAAIVHEPGCGWSIGKRFAVERDEEGGLPLSSGESGITECWLRYFRAIAIEGRLNPRLQASFMPKKYWKNLTEKEGGGGDGVSLTPDPGAGIVMRR
ncbi:MAG: hypothetical protein A2413_20400 [Treponema sp. RIFOXYC1_FULL_61_9]|nr:MAG: hypothetical protein A2001_06770 [Treponema sp. GWC1_61_84]OHE73225.1 MAG: hypothetical protein A2413_20400 [Treponema sp. RIFOXYC1_FULL_61_9]